MCVIYVICHTSTIYSFYFKHMIIYNCRTKLSISARRFLRKSCQFAYRVISQWSKIDFRYLHANGSVRKPICYSLFSPVASVKRLQNLSRQQCLFLYFLFLRLKSIARPECVSRQALAWKPENPLYWLIETGSFIPCLFFNIWVYLCVRVRELVYPLAFFWACTFG